MDLPARPAQHISGERAVALARLSLPKEWVFRELHWDYGIDAEVEIAGSTVTGNVFKVQVKGSQSVTWREDSTFWQPVHERTLNYWHVLPVPVVLLLVDLQREKVYWSPTDPVPLAAHAQDSGVSVSQRHVLPDTVRDLLSHVSSWISTATAKETLYSFPFLARLMEARLRRVDRDEFLPVEQHEVEEVRDLYFRVIRFARAVGVSVSSVLPWELWVSRSRRTWGDHSDLYAGTHDELVEDLRLLYDQAADRATELLLQEPPRPTCAAAISLAYQRKRGSSIHFSFGDPFADLDLAVWRIIEERLKHRGVLRYYVPDTRPDGKAGRSEK